MRSLRWCLLLVTVLAADAAVAQAPSAVPAPCEQPASSSEAAALVAGLSPRAAYCRLDPDALDPAVAALRTARGDTSGLSQIREFLWDPFDETWEPESRVTRTYGADVDTLGPDIDPLQVIEELLQGYEPAQEEYVNESRDLFLSYADDGEPDHQIFQLWDITDWANFQRTSRDFEPLLEVTTREYWDVAVEAWEPFDRDVVTFSEENASLPVEERLQFWNGAEWEDSGRTLFSYELELLMEEVNQFWNGSEWINTSRGLHAYDGDGLLTEHVGQNWNFTTMEWGNFTRDLYTYEGGLVAERVGQDWMTDEWVNSFRELFSFSADVLAEYRYETWDGAVWVNFSRVLFSYEDDLIVETITQEWDEGDWENAVRQLFTYRSFVDAEAEAPTLASSLALYPNPTAGSVTAVFSLDASGAVGFEVYDVLGRRVASVEEAPRPAGEHAVRVDLGRLAAGVYVLRASGDIEGGGRFVVQR